MDSIKKSMGSALLGIERGELSDGRPIMLVDWVGQSRNGQDVRADRVALLGNEDGLVRDFAVVGGSTIERRAIVEFFGKGDSRDDLGGMPELRHALRAGLGAAMVFDDARDTSPVSVRAANGRFLGCIGQFHTEPAETTFLLFDAKPVHSLPEKDRAAHRSVDSYDQPSENLALVDMASSGQVSLNDLSDGLSRPARRRASASDRSDLAGVSTSAGRSATASGVSAPAGVDRESPVGRSRSKDDQR